MSLGLYPLGTTPLGLDKQNTGGVTLVISDATHAHVADGLALTQDHQLAVADAVHAHAADNLALTQDHQLAIADATHGHTADNITFQSDVAFSRPHGRRFLEGITIDADEDDEELLLMLTAVAPLLNRRSPAWDTNTASLV